MKYLWIMNERSLSGGRGQMYALRARKPVYTQISEILDGHRGPGNYLQEVLLVESVQDVMPFVEETQKRWEEEDRAQILAEKRAQLAKLKKELGEP